MLTHGIEKATPNTSFEEKLAELNQILSEKAAISEFPIGQITVSSDLSEADKIKAAHEQYEGLLKRAAIPQGKLPG